MILAPYKVMRVDIDRDLEGWRPEKGAVDDLGAEIEDRIYNQRDFDRTLVLNQRTKLVAKKVVEQLEANDPYAKTIIFCEDIDHAERMRQAIVNANPERAQEDLRYVMRITGDNAEGKAQLDNFIHPEERYPVIATTSKLMTTGVDARTCKYVVLDQRIQSMTEFKQTIGRGTRLYPDMAKLYFTIIDFKKATELFADPDSRGSGVALRPEPNRRLRHQARRSAALANRLCGRAGRFGFARHSPSGRARERASGLLEGRNASIKWSRWCRCALSRFGRVGKEPGCDVPILLECPDVVRRRPLAKLPVHSIRTSGFATSSARARQPTRTQRNPAP